MILASGPALAEDLPDREAIAGQIRELIADVFRDATQKLKIGPVLAGEALNGVHPVSVAGVSARLSDDPEDEGAVRLAMDQFALTAEPLDADRLRLTHVTMPDGIALLSAAGQRIGSLGAASGRATGILSQRLGRLSALDMALDQPRLALDQRMDGGELLLARADRMAITGADSQGADGLWSSNGAFRAEGLALNDETESGFTLASLVAEGTLAGIPDMAMEAVSTMSAAPGAVDFGAISPDILRAGLLDAMAFSIDMRGLDFRGLPDAPDMTLDRLRGGVDLSGLRGETGRIALTAGLAGPKATATGKDIANWTEAIPSRLDLDLSLEGLPAQLIWATLAEEFAGASAGTLDQTGLALLATAPLSLSLNQLVLHLDGTQIEATGALRADAQAALGAVGHLDIVGKDLLLLKDKTATLPPEHRREAGDLFDYIYGGARPAADGTERDVVRFELLASGEILMNGAPFSPPEPGKRK